MFGVKNFLWKRIVIHELIRTLKRIPKLIHLLEDLAERLHDKPHSADQVRRVEYAVTLSLQLKKVVQDKIDANVDPLTRKCHATRCNGLFASSPLVRIGQAVDAHAYALTIPCFYETNTKRCQVVEIIDLGGKLSRSDAQKHIDVILGSRLTTARGHTVLVEHGNQICYLAGSHSFLLTVGNIEAILSARQPSPLRAVQLNSSY